jgi:hypothetical protein
MMRISMERSFDEKRVEPSNFAAASHSKNGDPARAAETISAMLPVNGADFRQLASVAADF